jgi:OPA family sugar phosphate sensor protein UhpC-like MFS transporter
MAVFDWLKPGPDAPLLADPSEVDRRFRRAQVSVLTAVTLGYGSAYTCRLGLGVIKERVIEENIFTATELGTIGSAFLFSYGFGKLINGVVADRTNIKRFWALGLFVSAIVNLLMGGTTAAAIATVLWAINGWFQGFLAPSSVIAITNWFHPRERGTIYGIWSASHALGEGLTFIFTAQLALLLGWRYAFIGPGLYCAVIALLAFIMLRDRPQVYGLPDAAAWRGKLLLGFFIGHHKGEKPSTSDTATVDTADTADDAPADDEGAPPSTDAAPANGDQPSRWKDMLVNPALWVVGTASACMYISRWAVNHWGILYLQKERGFGLDEASQYLALNTVLGILGSPIYGWISDRFFNSRRPPVTLLFGLLEIFSLVIIFFGPRGDALTLGVGWALYGFSISGLIAVLGGLFAVDICSKKMAGAAMGFVGCFSYIGAGLGDQITGLLIDAGTTRVDGVAVIDFTAPVTFWFGASIVSAILAASLWRVQVRD